MLYMTAMVRASLIVQRIFSFWHSSRSLIAFSAAVTGAALLAARVAHSVRGDDSYAYVMFGFVLIGTALLLAYIRWGRMPDSFFGWSILLIPVLVIALQPAYLSADLYDYISCARHAWRGENIYHIACNVSQTKVYAYGPLFLIVSMVPALGDLLVAGSSVYFFKLLLFIIYLASVRLIYLFLRARGDGDRAARCTLAYGWHAAILLESLQSGHNDVLVVLLLLLALFAYDRGARAWAVLALWAAGLIKLFPLLLIPFVLFFPRITPSRNGTRFRHRVSVTLLILTVLALGGLTYWRGFDFFHTIYSLPYEAYPVGYGVVPFLVYSFLTLAHFERMLALTHAHWTGVALIVMISWWGYFRAWRSPWRPENGFALLVTALLLCTSHWLVPWYLLWWYPLLILSFGHLRIDLIVLLIAFLGGLSMVIPVSAAILLVFGSFAAFQFGTVLLRRFHFSV